MRYKDLVSYVVSLTLLFLLALSTNFQFGLNLFNFTTIALFIMSILVLFSPMPNQGRPKSGIIFNYICRGVLIFGCVALGMFWQAAFWILITMILRGKK